MAIYINLKEELKHEDFIEKDLSINFKSLNLPKDYSSNSEFVNVHLYIIKDKEGYILSMSIKGDITLECARCLEPFNMNLSETSNIILTKKKPKKHNLELSVNELNIEFIEDEEKFNLTDIVREEILIQTPIKPLCDENCKGICQVCGGNKNEVECDCEKNLNREVSPFAKLKVLLEKKKG